MAGFQYQAYQILIDDEEHVIQEFQVLCRLECRKFDIGKNDKEH